MSRPPIRFFTDQNVADSAGNALKCRGYELVRLRECMATDSKDPVVALTCLHGGYVLVSHDTDFKAVAKRLAMTQRYYRQHLHRIDLKCTEPEAANRLAEAIGIIENEWSLACEKKLSMVIEIRSKSIVLHR